MKYRMLTARLWVRWRLATAYLLLLEVLSLIYGPNEPLPVVLRAAVSASAHGERYATAAKQDERAEKLRRRKSSASEELDVRSHAVAHRRS